jgi:drug/metabolite transporter (DMT)-like permease
VIAILGGLGAAVFWGAGSLFAARASRAIPPVHVLAWVMLIGLGFLALPAVWSGGPGALDGSELGWLAVAGVSNVVGLGLVYLGLRVGKVGIVAPLASTEGAIAAVLAVMFGEDLGSGAACALAVIVVGVVLAAISAETEHRPRAGLSIVCGLGAGLLFGMTLLAMGRVSDTVPVVWVALPARIVGFVAVFTPLAIGRRLPIPSGLWLVLTGAAVAEVAGVMSFAWGSTEGIATTAVLGSQFAALAAIGAAVFFGERLRRAQIAGVVVIMVGVAALSAFTAST